MINSRMLKATIVEAGFTQVALAKKLNISPNSLSSKINGRAKFDIDEATKLCDILNINEDKKKVNIFLA